MTFINQTYPLLNPKTVTTTTVKSTNSTKQKGVHAILGISLITLLFAFGLIVVGAMISHKASGKSKEIEPENTINILRLHGTIVGAGISLLGAIVFIVLLYFGLIVGVIYKTGAISLFKAFLVFKLLG